MKHGNFEKVEGIVKVWKESRDKILRRGGFVTKQWLIDNKSWDKFLASNKSVTSDTFCIYSAFLLTPRTMCDNAFDWARPLGRLRINPIHKAEEADIPYDDIWIKEDETGRRLEFESGFALDVSCHTVLCKSCRCMHMQSSSYVRF